MLSITYGISKVASYHVVLLVLARFGLLVVSGLSSKGRFLVVPASYSISPLYLSTKIPRWKSHSFTHPALIRALASRSLLARYLPTLGSLKLLLAVPKLSNMVTT
jgi:hypothetical protein